MRIIAGRFRGRALSALGKGDPTAHLRPTSDRVRESLFNVLTGGRMGDPVTGARVLDLFAGTGALGLEALSRGSSHVTFVENGTKALGLLGRNIALIGVAADCNVIRRDATRLGTNAGAPFDLAFMDPPYGKALGERALASAIASGWLPDGAIVVWEEAHPPEMPEDATPIDQRRYGDTVITVLRLGGGTRKV